MEFRFDVNDIFKQPIVEIGHMLIPAGFKGDRRQLWDTISKVTDVINAMGTASANAQGLTKSITTSDRLRNSDQQVLYLLVDSAGNQGRGAVTGMLKTGRKSLYVFDRDGHHYQVQAPCVLDFYVHESRQRSGYGKKIFEHMLQREEVNPHKLAIDRPSDKFLAFLNKHYGLSNPIRQMNNFVVYDDFFPKVENSDKAKAVTEGEPAVPQKGSNGLQAQILTSPYGRYGAPRPPCSMGQIIHNQSATVTTNEQTGASLNPFQIPDPSANPNLPIAGTSQGQQERTSGPKNGQVINNSENLYVENTNLPPSGMGNKIQPAQAETKVYNKVGNGITTPTEEERLIHLRRTEGAPSIPTKTYQWPFLVPSQDYAYEKGFQHRPIPSIQTGICEILQPDQYTLDKQVSPSKVEMNEYGRPKNNPQEQYYYYAQPSQSLPTFPSQFSSPPIAMRNNGQAYNYCVHQPIAKDRVQQHSDRYYYPVQQPHSETYVTSGQQPQYQYVVQPEQTEHGAYNQYHPWSEQQQYPTHYSHWEQHPQLQYQDVKPLVQEPVKQEQQSQQQQQQQQQPLIKPEPIQISEQPVQQNVEQAVKPDAILPQRPPEVVLPAIQTQGVNFERPQIIPQSMPMLYAPNVVPTYASVTSGVTPKPPTMGMPNTAGIAMPTTAPIQVPQVATAMAPIPVQPIVTEQLTNMTPDQQMMHYQNMLARARYMQSEGQHHPVNPVFGIPPQPIAQIPTAQPNIPTIPIAQPPQPIAQPNIPTIPISQPYIVQGNTPQQNQQFQQIGENKSSNFAQKDQLLPARLNDNRSAGDAPVPQSQNATLAPNCVVHRPLRSVLNLLSKESQIRSSEHASPSPQPPQLSSMHGEEQDEVNAPATVHVRLDRPQTLLLHQQINNNNEHRGNAFADARAQDDHVENDVSADELDEIEREMHKVDIAGAQTMPQPAARSSYSSLGFVNADVVQQQQRKSPHLTEQGYFDLKFYSHKLW